MPKYEALLAYDVPQYATVEFEAESDEAAIAEATRKLLVDKDDCFQEEFGSCWNERIVSLARVNAEDGKADYRDMVAADLELDPNPLHDNAFTLLQAAKRLTEKAERAVSLCGGGGRLNAEDRRELHDLTVEARAAIDACEGKQAKDTKDTPQP